MISDTLIEITQGLSSVEIGDIMALSGYKLHYESAYLVEKNWLQISILGQEERDIRSMLTKMEEVI